MQIVQDKHKYATDNDINKRQWLLNVTCKTKENCSNSGRPTCKI